MSDERVRSVGIRQLQRDASGVVGYVTRTGRPAFVTNRGEAVAVVYPVDPEALEDFILANAPEFVRSMAEADLALMHGHTRSARDVLAEPTEDADTGSGALVEVLTERQREVLLLVAEGYTTREIAESLDISASTVRRHLEHIVRQLSGSASARTRSG